MYFTGHKVVYSGIKGKLGKKKGSGDIETVIISG